MSEPSRALLSSLPRPAQWGLLFVLSLLIAGGLDAIGLPAALLVGPMVAGILIETSGGAIRTSPRLFAVAQAIIGCQIAHGITGSMLSGFARQWPLYLSVVGAAVLASCVLGWAMGRWRVMPGTTAVWGLLPGGASAMMLMAEAYGADIRLVAFMQYTRVVVVTLLAAMVAHFYAHVSGLGHHNFDWFPTLHWLPLLETAALIVGGIFLGKVSRMPAGILLLPMLIGAVLHGLGVMEIELPPVLLAAAYFLLGWNIGLRFTRQVLASAARALPQTFLAIAAIVAFCGGLAFLLVRFAGVDPLSAYLATSPGGIDTVAIIAASTHVDVAFVMSIQALRLIFILIAGPPMSRFFARHLERVHGVERHRA